MSYVTRTFVRAALLAMPLVALTACGKKDPNSQRTERTTNSEINFEVMFERRGCEIGRFYDGSRYIYVTLCDGNRTSSRIEYRTSCGKNCITDVVTLGATVPVRPDENIAQSIKKSELVPD